MISPRMVISLIDALCCEVSFHGMQNQLEHYVQPELSLAKYANDDDVQEQGDSQDDGDPCCSRNYSLPYNDGQMRAYVGDQ